LLPWAYKAADASLRALCVSTLPSSALRLRLRKKKKKRRRRRSRRMRRRSKKRKEGELATCNFSFL
jgi:hypothetical protein